MEEENLLWKVVSRESEESLEEQCDRYETVHWLMEWVSSNLERMCVVVALIYLAVYNPTQIGYLPYDLD